MKIKINKKNKKKREETIKSKLIKHVPIAIVTIYIYIWRLIRKRKSLSSLQLYLYMCVCAVLLNVAIEIVCTNEELAIGVCGTTKSKIELILY